MSTPAPAAATSAANDDNALAPHKAAMTDDEEAVMRGLKAQQSAIDKAEAEKFQKKPKGGAGAKIQGALTKFAEGVSQEHDMPLAEVLSTPKGAIMDPEQLEKALRELVSSHASQESASGGIKSGGPAADMQAALNSLRVAEARAKEEKLDLAVGVAERTREVGQTLSREQEDETLAMIRATAEQLMIDEIESRSKKNGGTRGIDTRIWKGSAAAKAQGAFAKYATALAMERGLSAAEIESSASFYSPVPSVREVAERVISDAATRESIESQIQGSALRRGVAAKMRSAGRKLYATTEAGRQAGSDNSGFKLLKGDEPLYVLGVTEEAENETLALLQRYATKLGDEGMEQSTGLQRAKVDAEMAVTRYAGALAGLRGLSVNEVKQKAASTDEVVETTTEEALLDRLRHQAVVLFVEERRVGTKTVEKGSAASLMQSAVDHFARSLRLVRQYGQKMGKAEVSGRTPGKVAAFAQDSPAKEAATAGEE